MLTQGDDYPLHQTPDPIAYSGTDRNFYERYWFNGFEPDGSLFWAIGMGCYPHLNILDTALTVLVDGKQHCLRGSRVLNMERMDTSVGPLRLEVVKPLWKLRYVVAEHEGIAADLTIEGRVFPIEEPRFTRRVGTRAFLDITRLTQNGRWSGWIKVDGKRHDLSPRAIGTRDRSWGVRPIGISDPQPVRAAGTAGLFLAVDAAQLRHEEPVLPRRRGSRRLRVEQEVRALPGRRRPGEVPRDQRCAHGDAVAEGHALARVGPADGQLRQGHLQGDARAVHAVPDEGHRLLPSGVVPRPLPRTSPCTSRARTSPSRTSIRSRSRTSTCRCSRS